jgi:hypothetical protein
MSRPLKIVISLLLLLVAVVPLSGNSCWNERMASNELSFSATTTNQFSPLVSSDWDLDELSPGGVVRFGGVE